MMASLSMFWLVQSQVGMDVGLYPRQGFMGMARKKRAKDEDNFVAASTTK